MIKSPHSVRIINQPNLVPDAARSGFYLEIQKGRTQFPYRPVRSSRFLIGNGPGCDLRLGGPEVPQLHCIVHLEDGQFRLESVASAPLLHVNQQPVTSTLLADGDHIAIGSIELVARFAQPESVASAALRGMPASSPAIPDFCFDEEEPSLSELTAEQLVDLIELEQNAADEYEIRRQLGAQAMVHVALEGNVSGDIGDPVADELLGTEMEILRKLEQAVERLRWFADSAESEADVNSALAERLQSLADRVTEPVATEKRGPRSAA